MERQARFTGQGYDVALVLAALSMLTAVVTVRESGSFAAGGGVAAVGICLGLVGRFGADALEDAWTEHRRYVGFATGLFAFGTLVGVALYLAGYDLIEYFLELLGEEFPVDEAGEGDEATVDETGFDLTAQLFIVQNTPPYLASIFGAITLGLFTAIVMIFNGILIGNIALGIGAEIGFGLTLALLVPHGIFELPALFLAAGVGFRLVHRFGQRVLGRRESFLTKPYLYRTTVLVVFGWLVLVLAAFVEAYVTFAIADFLFGGI